VLIVFCSCPDLALAQALASALVEQRLAACVQLLPGVQSVYRWDGAVERASEVQLQIKTDAARYAAVEAAILARHPYELPEIVAVESVAGLDRYLDWIGASTRPDAVS
jgi:periplasmic divalent cation tolerance protein